MLGDVLPPAECFEKLVVRILVALAVNCDEWCSVEVEVLGDPCGFLAGKHEGYLIPRVSDCLEDSFDELWLKTQKRTFLASSFAGYVRC